MPLHAVNMINHFTIFAPSNDIFDIISTEAQESGFSQEDENIMLDAALDLSHQLYLYVRASPPLHFLFTSKVVEISEIPFTNDWWVLYEPDEYKFQYAVDNNSTWGWLSHVQQRQYTLF